MNILPARFAVVVLTHNRKTEILRTLKQLCAVTAPATIYVVDNASTDGSTDSIGRHFPGVRLIRLDRNHGAAGRNFGARAVAVPYIAFCDDDCWWEPGSIERALSVFDDHPRLAAVTARVLVGPQGGEDPASRVMAASPLPNILGVPGTAVSGLLAGACIVRRRAFLEAGGYEPRFFIGSEERLLAIDLMAGGWHLAYVPEVVVHHHPSSRRDTMARRRLLLRNALWCAWLRRPFSGAGRETLRHLRAAFAEPQVLANGFFGALAGLPWVLRNRQVVPEHVESCLRLLDEAPGA